MSTSSVERKAVASVSGSDIEDEQPVLTPATVSNTASDGQPGPSTSQGPLPESGKSPSKEPEAAEAVEAIMRTNFRDDGGSPALAGPSYQNSSPPNYTRHDEHIQSSPAAFVPLNEDSEYGGSSWDRDHARRLNTRHSREIHTDDGDFSNKFSSVSLSGPEESSSHSGHSQPGDESPSSPGNTPLLSRSPVQTRESRQSHLSPTARQIPPRSDIVIPRWQPDAEVTFCPICTTQFSFFVRKHHCRKCGRVVCNSCSPHRITIPYQYIVQPPKDPTTMGQSGSTSRPSRDAARADSSQAVASLGGGESVRICNPCVPDPNTTPPPQITHGNPPTSQSTQHARTASTPRLFSNSRVIAADNQPTWGGMPRDRRLPIPASAAGASSSYNASHLAAIYGTATGSLQNTPNMGDLRSRSSTIGASARDDPTQSMASLFSRPLPRRPVPHQSGSSSNSNPQPHYRPLIPRDDIDPAQPVASRRRVPEEDLCPICFQEVPGRNLPNAEAIKEAHVIACIESSMQAHSRTPPASRSNRHSMQPTSGNTPSSSSRPTPPIIFQPIADTPAARTAAREAAHAAVVRAASGHAPSPARRPHCIQYAATEKDTIDSAECTICLEEFEPGQAMGRLECFCKFHLHCIKDWLNRNEQCPIHKVASDNAGN